MEILCTLLLCLPIILDYMGSTSQSNRSPEHEPNFDDHHSGPSPSGRHCRNMSYSPASHCHSIRSSPPDQIPLRGRSRSPVLRKNFPSVLGYRFEDLEYIRLIPHKSPNQMMELRRYVFPPDKPIRLRTRTHSLILMPSEEQIVLSTTNGDVYAILERASNRRTILRAIFTALPGRSKRVKINMNSGAVEELTEGEIAKFPVLPKESIRENYGVLKLNSQSEGMPDGGIHHGAHPGRPSTSPTSVPHPPTGSPTLRETFYTILGHEFEDLESIRIIPHNNPNRIFELRKYIFSPNQPIRLRTRTRILNPMPPGEQIVLSTSDGDVCAILQKSPNRRTILRGIFTPVPGMSERAKININSGEVDALTAKELAECPLVYNEAFTKLYRVLRV